MKLKIFYREQFAQKQLAGFLLVVLLSAFCTTAQEPPDRIQTVWDSTLPFPSETDIPYPAGAMDIMVHRAGTDRYGFLHDAAIVEHKKILFAAWYNCPSGEMEDESLIRCRRSADGGHTWSEPEIIAGDRHKKGILYVPVTFLSQDGHLYAFVSNMEGGPDKVTRCEVFVLQEKENAWQSEGFIAGPFLPNCSPVKMKDNNYIMAGRMAVKPGELPVIPAVAISRGEKVAQPWEVIPLSYNGKLPSGDQPDFPETTVLADGKNITAFVRNHSKYPILFTSSDFGKTWSGPKAHNFPFASSKIFAGTLSTGQNYVVSNLVSKEYRDLLTIAVTKPGEKQFCRIWKIRNGYNTSLQAGAEWSYPCAMEYDGRLYIVYTSEKHHCCLTVIPVGSLDANH